MIARKHCAGRRRKPDGEEILRAFRRGPESNDEEAKAIMWILGTITIAECVKLVVRCGVSYEEIARFARAGTQKRDDLVRYLNQFTIPSTSQAASASRFATLPVNGTADGHRTPSILQQPPTPSGRTR